MSRKLLTLIFLVCAFAMVSVPSYAQMTDDAVITYLKNGVAAGRSQKEMAKELAAKGVTKEQAERIKAKYEQEQASQAGTAKGPGEQGRLRRMDENALELQELEMDIDSTSVDTTDVREVYGRNIFKIKELTFAPNANLPTPVNYVLGAGDEVIIDIWGTNQTTIRQIISPDGTINIPDLGLVSLSGMKVKDADSYLRKKLGQIYSVDGADAKSEIKLTLGNIRTIQVNLMGEVANPGTYFLSSLSNVYHALYRAGGVSELGSLRDIQLVRKGKKIATIDIYEFIRDGKMDDTILQDGDVITVPSYKVIVDIAGSIKRPMAYEMKQGETVADLIEYAAGFAGDAYSDNISIVRQNGREYQIATVSLSDYGTFTLMDGDAITVGTMLDRFSNRVQIDGAVYRPGAYELGDKIKTVSQLIAFADGLKGDAFTNRALITREREDLTLEIIPFDVTKVLNGTAEDIKLAKNDVVYIPSIHDLNDVASISIEGEVAKPGSFVFAENTTIEDAIILAGGLLESASTVRIDVSRRINKPTSETPTGIYGEVFTFAFKDGYVIDGQPGFILKPYDHIMVRKSPDYMPQQLVKVTGEVAFPGSYSMVKKEERISDLVAKAGGITNWAYLRGARLQRKIIGEEKTRMLSTKEFFDSARDSVNMKRLDMDERYFVGIDLAKALANPGSDADLVLREGDILGIPEYINTVKISGNVMFPNTVTYDPNMTVRKYVTMAGGYGYRSQRSKAYVIYLNGTIEKARRFSSKVVEPGCEIVIPEKPEKKSNLQDALSITSSVTSMAAMLATMISVLK